VRLGARLSSLPLFTELPRGKVFSETLMQPCGSLYVRTGAKRHFAAR
jgi:hypothetical protein